MKLQSEFALLDIKHGRKQLVKHFKKGGEPIDVVITGKVAYQWGSDDGTSVEFSVDVEKVEVKDKK